MEHSRRKNGTPMWLNNSLQLWASRNDITVVNLRDVSEPFPTLGSENVPAMSPPITHPSESAGNSNAQAQSVAQEMPLDAILSKLTGGSDRLSSDSRKLLANLANINKGTRSRLDSAVPESEAQASLFPESNPSNAMDVEFVKGVNLPGSEKASHADSEGLRRKEQSGMHAMALFHDPVWGDVSNSYDVEFSSSNTEETDDILNHMLGKFKTRESGSVGAVHSTELAAATQLPSPPHSDNANLVTPPPPFPTHPDPSEAFQMFHSAGSPPVATSPPPHLSGARGANITADGWAATQAHAAAGSMQPFQFVPVTVPFMMPMTQPYRVPYSYYSQVPTETLQNQQMMGLESRQTPSQMPTAPNSSCSHGTNIGAAPFVPKG